MVTECERPLNPITACCSCTGSVAELRKKVAMEHEQVKQKDHTPKASYGYGGKFGVERDRMDKVRNHVFSAGGDGIVLVFPERFLGGGGFLPVQVALGNDYVAQVEKHSSQKDASKGFGGKFGVQEDRVDKVGTQFQDLSQQRET